MPRASACGSSWLSVESRRVALATIATPSRADAPRRRPVAAVRHATAAEAPATHWAGRQKARAALASATRLMSESDRASFAAYDVEFVVEISRCRARLHRSTTEALRPAADVELYSAPERSTSLQLYSALHSTSSTPSLRRRLCFKEGRYGSRSCGTAESTEGGTSPSDMVPYLRMLVVGDIRARSYATGQQSLGDETTDLARRSDTECCSTLRHRRVPRAALNLAEYTSRYHPASRRSGCLICRKTPTSLLLEESFR